MLGEILFLGRQSGHHIYTIYNIFGHDQNRCFFWKGEKDAKFSEKEEYSKILRDIFERVSIKKNSILSKNFNKKYIFFALKGPDFQCNIVRGNSQKGFERCCISCLFAEGSKDSVYS